MFLPAGVRHGWIFEVPGYGTATGQPLRAMGKSDWEAVAVDPATGIVYQTEDVTPGGFYKFVPNQYGKLHLGGALFALKVAGTRQLQLQRPERRVRRLPGRHHLEHGVGAGDRCGSDQRSHLQLRAGPRLLSPVRKAAYYDSGKIYFTCTSGGIARQGQVFVYDPRRETLTMVFNSTGAGTSNTECNMPDNIAVSPRGGIVLCEDGGNSIQRLRGLTQSGGTFIFAENRMNLSAANIAQADAALNAGGQIIATIPAGQLHQQ